MTNERSDFRVTGQWNNGGIFIILFGSALHECKVGLKGALAHYTNDDLKHIEYVWVDWWSGKSWVYFCELNLRAIRYSRKRRQAYALTGIS